MNRPCITLDTPRTKSGHEASMKLADKVAVVTGGGRGIGRAIALAFAQEGASVVVAARTTQEIEGTAVEIRKLGHAAMAVRTDVSKWDEVVALMDQSAQAFGQVDILVNNAGVQGSIGALVDNPVVDWVEALHINLIGVFYCMKAALPFMMATKRGKIINLSGGGAAGPRPYFSSYAAAKAAVVRLTETVAKEVENYNIQVNAMAPGPCNTRMFREILAAGAAAGPKSMEETARQLETGGTPLEIPAALAVFLASDESDGLSGRLISSLHDDYQAMKPRFESIMMTDWYTLRRIDPFTLKKLDPSWQLEY